LENKFHPAPHSLALSASDAELNLPADWNTLRKNATIYYFAGCAMEILRGVCFISHIASQWSECVIASILSGNILTATGIVSFYEHTPPPASLFLSRSILADGIKG
jgi:hypothetical protein